MVKTIAFIINSYWKRISACMMTPTEILSYQHYNKFKDICKVLNINIKVFTGSSKTSYKKQLKRKPKQGEINFTYWNP